jgi:hypothetical protein
VELVKGSISFRNPIAFTDDERVYRTEGKSVMSPFPERIVFSNKYHWSLEAKRASGMPEYRAVNLSGQGVAASLLGMLLTAIGAIIWTRVSGLMAIECIIGVFAAVVIEYALARALCESFTRATLSPNGIQVRSCVRTNMIAWEDARAVWVCPRNRIMLRPAIYIAVVGVDLTLSFSVDESLSCDVVSSLLVGCGNAIVVNACTGRIWLPSAMAVIANRELIRMSAARLRARTRVRAVECVMLYMPTFLAIALFADLVARRLVIALALVAAANCAILAIKWLQLGEAVADVGKTIEEAVERG